MGRHFRAVVEDAGFPPWIVPDYWLMLTLAIVVATLITLSLWRRAGGEPGRAADLLFWGILALFVGAKFFYFLQYGFPSSISRWWSPQGFALYGGLFGMVAVWLLLFWARPFRLGLFLDCVAPSLGVGLFLGRIGCFLAGCNGGTVTGSFLGVAFPAGTSVYNHQRRLGQIEGREAISLPVHPTQLYEAFFGLVAAGLLLWMFKRKTRDGEVFLVAILWYSVWRFLTECIRSDSGGLHPFGILTFAQTASLVVALTSLLGLLLISRLGSRRLDSVPGTPT